MKRNFNMHFYLKRPKNRKDELWPIYLRITIDKKVAECSVGRKATKNEWQSSGRIKGTNVKAKSFNDYLKHFEVQAYESHRLLIAAGKEVTAESLINKITGKEEKPRTLLGEFQEHNDRMNALVGSDFAAMTLKRYQTAMRHVKEFIELNYKKKDIELKYINYRFITDYDFFLRSVRKCANNLCISVKVTPLFRAKLATKLITE